MSRPHVNFEKVLAKQGVPTTSKEVATLLEHDVQAANSIISNDSAMSPFWKLFSACVVTPILWLVKTLLARHVLPAMFAATATDIYLELKAWDVGLKRKSAVNTQGNISFTKKAIDTDITIKAGTEIHSDRRLGGRYVLRVLQDTIIAPGTLKGLVACEATEAGEGHNLASGYYHTLVTAIDGIASVSNEGDWITTTGANQETDEELALRIRDQFGSVGHYHIDAVYRGAIASFAGIRSDLLYFEHNAPRGPGTANCHVMMAVGETPQTMIDRINDYLHAQGHHGHGDDLLAMPIQSTPVDLSVDIWHSSNLSAEDISTLINDIESRIRAAFRESDRHASITRTAPQTTFVFSLLSSELHSLLPDLQSVRWHLNDLQNGLELPRINQLMIHNRGVR